MVNRHSNAILKCYLDTAQPFRTFPKMTFFAREQKQMVYVGHKRQLL